MQKFHTGSVAHSIRLQRDQEIGSVAIKWEIRPSLIVSEEYFARYPVSKHQITNKQQLNS